MARSLFEWLKAEARARRNGSITKLILDGLSSGVEVTGTIEKAEAEAKVKARAQREKRLAAGPLE
jgi:hypothetical protein